MNQDQLELPIQPVEQPILCSPYEEPTAHWVYDTQTGEASKQPGRREAGYWYKTERTGSDQLKLFQEEQRDDLPLVNALRDDVRRWRNSKYESGTNVTKELLRHWGREDLRRRLFFCQREAVETIIYLVEILQRERGPRFNPKFSKDDLFKLVDSPNDLDIPDLIRYGCKMATGSGKTVVMAMLIAWAFCNRGKVPSDERFPAAALVVCPNLTIKQRLQVLRPEDTDNYYDEFELIPTKLRPLLNSGKVLVTNWHQFAPESEHSEGGKTYTVVNKGKETPDVFAKRVLGELHDRAPIMVLNDEGHHAYRPAPTEDKLSAEEKRERQDATVWVEGLDKINGGCGIKFCVDLSATPFYIKGSGYREGSPFPWLVSDFGLVDAIESGITKIPRLPVSDNTGRPEPKFFRLWKTINDAILPAERLPGRARKPKPEVVYREAEDALRTLASQWEERFGYIEEASDKQDKTPPVLIIVCDNTDIAEYFYQRISRERVVEDIDENSISGKGKKKAKTKIAYGQGPVFSELFSNTKNIKRTLRIDSKMLAQAESGDPNQNASQAAEALREIVATIGKPGKPGAQIRCVVSVAMLNEGWDANNVTHIFGLRAFTSQLLCEQVVGRGLRRMNYTPDPETGLLTEEYVDVYGIPFSVIPFRGRKTKAPEEGDRPKNHVRALPARKAYEIRFPVVEGYAFALQKNEIKADIKSMEPLRLDLEHTPTDVFVKAAVGYQIGETTTLGPGEFVEQNRNGYYRTTHIQTIKFEIAGQIVWRLVGDSETVPDPQNNPGLRLRSRHRLFPQVFKLVDNYIESKVDFRGCNRCELGLEKYVTLIVERLVAAIQPDETEGETPLLPILNRYKSVGTSAAVDFFTTRACHGTQRSQVNQVVLDTKIWERSACFWLEQSNAVKTYVRNDHLGLTIPYEYLGITHHYEPDFIVRLQNGVNLLLETKGYAPEQTRAKHAGAKRWVSAVNNWNRKKLGEPEQRGPWAFYECTDPQRLRHELAAILEGSIIPI
ncbi:MAG: DEAD/DEAH box helicase family protein [Candidatus Poribacteria bacterium]|nr:DEAD/DEAH box helicase family protein [Candidatus Poribacteria bacterium]